MVVILVSAGEDLRILDVVVSSVLEYLVPTKIYCISNRQGIAAIKNKQLEIVDERDVISYTTLDLLQRKPVYGFPQRTSWYYQQFLKIEFCRFLNDTDYYLIWDADTIVLQPIEFFDSSGNVLFTVGHEKLNTYYRENYERLTGIEYLSKVSFISQHMLIDAKIMKEFMGIIEGRYNKPFALAVLDNIRGNSLSLFSEYEFYANYYMASRDNYRLVKRNWLRHGRPLLGESISEDVLVDLSKYYCYISYEKFDGTFLAKVKANLLHRFNMLSRRI